jgi:antitoxin component YwqK of YwqJK toxin-antitoxin module
MPDRKPSNKKHIVYHKDGSVWAKGNMVGGNPHGYWEWFRKDGIKMRSGYFKKGKQVGEWTTYDKKGNVYKVTQMKI